MNLFWSGERGLIQREQTRPRLFCRRLVVDRACRAGTSRAPPDRPRSPPGDWPSRTSLSARPCPSAAVLSSFSAIAIRNDAFVAAASRCGLLASPLCRRGRRHGTTRPRRRDRERLMPCGTSSDRPCSSPACRSCGSCSPAAAGSSQAMNALASVMSVAGLMPFLNGIISAIGDAPVAVGLPTR